MNTSLEHALTQALRTHTFTSDELAPPILMHWPQASSPRPWDEQAALKLAISARHDSSGRPTPRAQLALIQEHLGYEQGALCEQALGFWFSVFGDHLYMADHYGAPDISAEKMQPHLLAARAGALEDIRSTRHERLHEMHAMVARILREVMPYVEVMELALEHSLDLFQAWMPYLGPPLEHERPDALAILEALWCSEDVNLCAPQLHKILRLLPSQVLIAKMLEDVQARRRLPASHDMVMLAMELEEPAPREAFLGVMKRSLAEPPLKQEVWRFFARFGYESPELLFKKILWYYRKKSDFKEIFKVALKIKSPEVVMLLPDFARVKGLGQLVDEYVSGAQPWVLEGLLQLTRARTKKQEWALQMMRQLVGADEQVAHRLKARAEHHPDQVRALVEEQFFGEADTIEARAIIDYLPEPEWSPAMRSLLKVRWSGKAASRPGWLHKESLPVLYLEEDERALPMDVAMGMVAGASRVYGERASKARAKQERLPGDVAREEALAQVMASVEGEGADRLIAHVLELWRDTRKPEHGHWVMGWAAHWGGAVAVDVLGKFIKDRRNNSEHQKHLMGIWRAMRALASLDLAQARQALLWQASHLHPVALRGDVEALIQSVCEQRHWSREDFEDLAIPSLGLQRDGTRQFELGARTLTMRVKGRAEVVFEDRAQDKEYASFPARRKDDDAERYLTARQQFAATRAPLRLIFEQQCERLQRLMAREHAWPVLAWQDRVVSHPILGHMARGLLWKLVDEDFNTQAFVLPDASGSFMDLDMEEVVPDPERHRVVLAHAVELEPAQLKCWLERLADFELIQPFEQLDVDVHRRADAPRELAALGGLEKLSAKVLHDSRRHGWAFTIWCGCLSGLSLSSPGVDASVQIKPAPRLRADKSFGAGCPTHVGLEAMRAGDAELFSAGVLDGSVLEQLRPVAWSELVSLLRRARAV